VIIHKTIQNKILDIDTLYNQHDLFVQNLHDKKEVCIYTSSPAMEHNIHIDKEN